MPRARSTWLVADQLGTTTLALDATGAVVADARYWPYGALRSGGVAQTDRRYTGQRQEAAQPALGLYDYRARFYSTLMGRFVSADPVTKDGWNRFSYVDGNPATRSDPSGQSSQPAGEGDTCDAACGLRALADSGYSAEFWLTFAAVNPHHDPRLLIRWPRPLLARCSSSEAAPIRLNVLLKCSVMGAPVPGACPGVLSVRPSRSFHQQVTLHG